MPALFRTRATATLTAVLAVRAASALLDSEGGTAVGEVDAHLAHRDRRSRMVVCMDLVEHYAAGHEREVHLYVQQLSDRLSEHDSKNHLFHSLLVNCYHAIEQEEVKVYGSQELSEERLLEVLSRPEDQPKLRFDERQTAVLDELLRETAALGNEVEFFGKKWSDVSEERRLLLCLVAVAVCALPVAAISVQLLCPRGSAGARARKPRHEGGPERAQDRSGRRRSSSSSTSRRRR